MPAVIDPARTTYRIVHNPHSGDARRNARIVRATEQFIRDHRLRADRVETTGPTHATQLARQAIAEGCDVVVAMGGDGTMNEVAQAVVGSGVPFGLIPSGSGNGLGRHLGLHGPIEHTLAALVTGSIRSIDTGTADGRPFFNVMGIGYDAALSVRFNALTDRGLWPYLREGLKLWRAYRPANYTLQANDKVLHRVALMVAVANSDQYGYNCFIAPGAKVDDGRMSLVVVKPISALGFVPLAYRLRRGTAHQSPHVEGWEGEKFIIERTEAGPLHTDGEVHSSPARVEVNTLPRSLQILVPA